MKKIFLYVGTPRKESVSNSFRYINKVLARVREIMGNENFVIDIFHPNNSLVNKCLGCERCFYHGECPQDKTDDMKFIKEKMLDADIVILTSPIYAVNVSGDMKIFFDRISSFIHLLSLRGKVGICLLSSCGNGVYHTLNFMKTVMTFLGLDIVDCYNVSFFTKDHLEVQPDYMQDKINETAGKIVEFLKDEKFPGSNESLENIYSNMKNYVKQLKKHKTYEYTYWKKNKMFDFETFEELIEYERAKKEDE